MFCSVSSRLTDNASGIAEMSDFLHEARSITGALDLPNRLCPFPSSVFVSRLKHQRLHESSEAFLLSFSVIVKNLLIIKIPKQSYHINAYVYVII